MQVGIGFGLGWGMAVLVSGCGRPSDRVAALRDALDQARVSLAEAAGAAEAGGSRAIRASLSTSGAAPVYEVDATGVAAGATVDDVRVDIVSGAVLSRQASAAAGRGACPGAVSLADAIAAAEREAGGTAVSSGPDDDDACDTEVMVLVGDRLWEVKISPDGALAEPPEEADDDEDADAAGA